MTSPKRCSGSDGCGILRLSCSAGRKSACNYLFFALFSYIIASHFPRCVIISNDI